MDTLQEKFWQSKFGRDYIKRNFFSNREMDRLYVKNYGVSRSEMNRKFLGNLRIKNVLEVGCNAGNQLALLQKQGFKNLYGIEIYDKAVELSRTRLKNVNIIWDSVFDIPFKDNYFDLVFTSGLLIHISPKDIKKAMKEIYRVSKKYIWGFEYYNDEYISIDYRGHKNCLWKGNFVKMYLNLFPSLRLVRVEKLKYLNDNNVDIMFLLKK